MISDSLPACAMHADRRSCPAHGGIGGEISGLKSCCHEVCYAHAQCLGHALQGLQRWHVFAALQAGEVRDLHARPSGQIPKPPPTGFPFLANACCNAPGAAGLRLSLTYLPFVVCITRLLVMEHEVPRHLVRFAGLLTDLVKGDAALQVLLFMSRPFAHKGSMLSGRFPGGFRRTSTLSGSKVGASRRTRDKGQHGPF